MILQIYVSDQGFFHLGIYEILGINHLTAKNKRIIITDFFHLDGQAVQHPVGKILGLRVGFLNLRGSPIPRVGHVKEELFDVVDEGEPHLKF